MQSLTIVGIMFLVLCVVLAILTPFYWCIAVQNDSSACRCCAPALAISVFMIVGVALIIVGEV
jgi:hypothetical protein